MDSFLPARLSEPRAAGRLRLWFALLIVVAVAWTTREIPAFDSAALMDDDTNIFFNPHLGAPTASRLAWMFGDLTYVHRYQPLGWLGFDLVFAGSGLDPAGYHWACIFFHALNSVLVFALIDRILRRFATANPAAEHVVFAGLVALAWALHPLRVETTSWCSGLLYGQAGCFALLAAYARTRELDARAAGGAGGAGWFLVVLAAAALSLLTYPVALALPIGLALLDFAWSRRPGAIAPRAGRVLRWEVALVCALAAAAFALTLLTRMTYSRQAPVTLADFGVVQRVLQAAFVGAAYVWRTLWPAHLSPVQDNLFEIHPADFVWTAALVTLLVISGIVFRLRHSRPYLALCWLSYLLLLGPYYGFLEHPYTASDRYSYTTTLGFYIAAALGLLGLARPRARAAGALALVVLGSLWAAQSVRQARIWREPRVLHDQIFARLKDAEVKDIVLARIAKLDMLAGNVARAREFIWALRVEHPAIAGVVRTWEEVAPRQPVPPELARRPLQEWPAAPWACAHEQIGRDLVAAGRVRDALIHFDAALALSPEFDRARLRRALARLALGDVPGALHDWLATARSSGPRDPAREFLRRELVAGLQARGDGHLAGLIARRADD